MTQASSRNLSTAVEYFSEKRGQWTRPSDSQAETTLYVILMQDEYNFGPAGRSAFNIERTRACARSEYD